MASYLCDTNLLLRLVDAGSPLQGTVAQALALLLRERHQVHITAQNLIEFWAVATRPVEANGLGWTRERTAQEVAELRKRFPLLGDSPAVFEEWLKLVESTPISGKRVHDARLAAVMKANGIEHLLTLNGGDFTAFTGLSIVNPVTLPAGQS
jgi:predicted nucleic acid-binding protein